MQEHVWWEFSDSLSDTAKVRYRIEKRTVGEADRFEITREGQPINDVGQELKQRQVLRVLQYFIDTKGETFGRSEILDSLWPIRSSDKVLDIYLGRLRLLLRDPLPLHTEDLDQWGRLIITVRGKGLKFGGTDVTSGKGSTSGIGEDGSGTEAFSRLIPLSPFATVPPLVHFIERPEVSEPLTQKLLSPSGPVGLTAIEGMGGVGKTMLAIRLCHDPNVQAAFPDGIVWLTIGSESRSGFEEHVKTVAQVLNQEFHLYSRAAYHSIHSIFKNKAILIVLDDAWTLEQIEPFLIPPGRSRLLYTSRNKTLAGSLHAESQEVGELNETQARYFLARWSCHERDLPEPHTAGILAECKGLALGLSMIGAALRSQPDTDWARMLADLRKARLRDIGSRPAGYAYETLHAAIAVSVDSLDSANKGRYLQLAVLLDDMAAATAVLQALWGVDEHEVHRIAQLFANRSLARRDDDGLRLHAFQLKYIRGEHADPSALALQRSAVLRSYHVIRQHPEQFSSQMTGRLLGQGDHPGVSKFLESLRVDAPRPRLRPLRPALAPPNGPNERVLDCSPSVHTALALTADGKCAVSGAFSGEITIWDLDGQHLPRVLPGHEDGINAVGLTPDGKRAISGSEDGQVLLWDLEDYGPPRVFEGHKGRVNAVSLRSDGKYAISGSSDVILIWDLQGMKPPQVLKCDGKDCEGVICVALTSDGNRAIAGFHDERLVVWNLDGEPPKTLKGNRSFINVLAVTPDGNNVISGANDGVLLVFDPSGRQPPRVLGSHSEPVTAAALTPDGQHAITGFSDGTVVFWYLDGSRSPQVLVGHKDSVDAVAITVDGARAVSTSQDDTLIVWNLRNSDPSMGNNCKSKVRAIALTNDVKRVVSVVGDGTLIPGSGVKVVSEMSWRPCLHRFEACFEVSTLT